MDIQFYSSKRYNVLKPLPKVTIQFIKRYVDGYRKKEYEDDPANVSKNYYFCNVSFDELMEYTGYSGNHVHNQLTTLEDLGYLSKSETGRLSDVTFDKESGKFKVEYRYYFSSLLLKHVYEDL